MSKLSTARKVIAEALASAEHPCVLTSFGKDSLLLLYLAREVKPDIAVLYFKQRASKAQQVFVEQIIKAWDLAVLSYAPATSYFLPNDEGLTLVDEHSFGQVTLPLLTDTTDGTECAIHLLGERTPFFAYPFDVTLWGVKATDKHFVLGSHPCPADGFQLGPTSLYTPLRDFTDTEVLQAIAELKIPYEAIDDTLSVCTRCLQGTEPVYCPEVKATIPAVVWQPNERLAEFRQRFL